MSEERPRLRVTTPPPDKKALMSDEYIEELSRNIDSWDDYGPPTTSDVNPSLAIPPYTSTFYSEPSSSTSHHHKPSAPPVTAANTSTLPDYGHRSPDYGRRSPDFTRRSPSPRYGRSTDPRGPQTREQAPFVDRSPNPHRHYHRGGGSRGGHRQYNGTGAPRPNYRQNDTNPAVVFDLLFSIPVGVWHRHGFHPPMRFHEERKYFANFYASDAARAQ